MDTKVDYQQLFEKMHQGYWIAERNLGTSLFLDANLLKTLGYPSDKKLTPQEFFGEEFVLDTVSLKNLDESFKISIPLKNAAGESVNSVCRISLHEDGDNIIGIVCELGSTLNKSGDQLKFFNSALISALPVALFCKDYSGGVGKFVEWNESAVKLWGLDPADVLGKSDFDLFPDDQAKFFQEKDLETIDSGEMVYIEKEPVDSPTLGRRFVRTWKVPVVFDEGKEKFLLGISLDVSEQVKLGEELEVEKSKTIQASKLASLGEMAAGIAHEINNPLAIIQGQANYIQKENDKNNLSSGELDKRVHKIFDTISRISKIIDGLRTFARDNDSDHLEAISIKKVVNDSLGMTRSILENRGIKLCVNVEIDCLAMAHSVQLSQVMINLLNNARGAVEKEKDKWVSIEGLKEDGFIFIKVTDSGPGISQDIEKKIFDPFFTTKITGEGTGLGLSISKGILEKFHGDLIYNNKCANTQFIIKIPEYVKE